MKNYYDEKNGYSQTIQKGMIGARTFTKKISEGKGTKKEKIEIISPIKNRTIQYGKKLIASSQ